MSTRAPTGRYCGTPRAPSNDWRAGGLPLGINTSLPYQSGSATLAKGDLLLIFTDGLVEAEGDGEPGYGEERTLPVVQPLQTGTAAEAIQRIMAPVDAFVGLTRQARRYYVLVLRMT